MLAFLLGRPRAAAAEKRRPLWLAWPCRWPILPDPQHTQHTQPGLAGCWRGHNKSATHATTTAQALPLATAMCEQSEQTSKAIAGDFARLLAEPWRGRRDPLLVCSQGREANPKRGGDGGNLLNRMGALSTVAPSHGWASVWVTRFPARRYAFCPPFTTCSENPWRVRRVENGPILDACSDVPQKVGSEQSGNGGAPFGAARTAAVSINPRLDEAVRLDKNRCTEELEKPHPLVLAVFRFGD